MQEKNKETWRYFWAKTDRDNPENTATHPLWAHLFDVGHTALLLWERNILSKALKTEICQTLNMNEQEAGHFVALCIGLHDLGKAIPSFQFQHTFSKQRLEKHGFVFKTSYEVATDRMAHGHASIFICKRWLDRQHELDKTQQCFLLNMISWIGFHHGNLAKFSIIEGEYGRLPRGLWHEGQDQILENVIQIWQVSYPFSFPKPTLKPRKDHPSWLLGFAGFVTLADWLGSMGECFSPSFETKPEDDLRAYLSISRKSAEQALTKAGFGLNATMQEKSFEALFPELQDFPMRPLQEKSLWLNVSSEAATLTIIEAPTGEGKTEAAFILANRQQVHAQQGIYVAMPTQAMSNGLFGRFKRFLINSHDENDQINVRLVHGNDFINDEQQQLLFSPLWKEIAQEEQDDDEPEKHEAQKGQQKARKTPLRTAYWFMPKKRALLARYGLGTIDQALLSILPAKHFFLRLYGLAGKTVIFDEVHAYDAYMTDLLCRLLTWLKALNCQVILLSATLPSKTRQALLEAFDLEGTTNFYPENVPYPCLWTSLQPEPIDFEHDKSREQIAHLHWKSDDLVALSVEIRAQFAKGATIAVILNTVDRAQRLFELLSDLKVQNPNDVYVFHARFPLAKRQAIENAVLERFGKKRPNRGSVLIATQVAEASLDLDFDVMYSELAPVDLLLQRAGRLHRHQRDRVQGFEKPTLYLLCGNDRHNGNENELPSVDTISGSGKVYARVILWRTFLVLKEKSFWHLPFDYRPLIEAVYPQQDEIPTFLSDAMQKKWQNSLKSLEKDEHYHKEQADQRMINLPKESKQLVQGQNLQLHDEDAPNIQKALRAITRLGDSVSVICLHQKGNDPQNLFFDQGYKNAVNTSLFEDEKAYRNKNVQEKINDFNSFYLQSLSLSAKDVVSAIHQHKMKHRTKEEALPDWWDKIVLCLPALQYHYPMVFIDGIWQHGTARPVQFNTLQGLIIRKPDLNV